MEELERLVVQTERVIGEHIGQPEYHPGKASVWIKLVKLVPMDHSQMEETVGSVHKVILTAGSLEELIRAVAENLVLAVYGGEVQVVTEMPNLIVRLFNRKAYVPTPGAPPLHLPGQTYLKATVYRWEPSLWEQFFPKKQTTP
jgi:hypothetical protein